MQKNALSISKGRNRASSQIKETAYSNAKDTIIGIGFTQQSAVFGGILGEITGAIMGTLTGAITMNLTGILMGFTAGVMLGALAGSLIGIAVSQTAGRNGGPSIGAFTGMLLGPILGTIIGLFIPDSIRMSASTLQIPVLNAITSSRFETVSLFAFLFCILGTLVGVWVSGKNYKPQK
jgi:hypothetical protein